MEFNRSNRPFPAPGKSLGRRKAALPPKTLALGLLALLSPVAIGAAGVKVDSVLRVQANFYDFPIDAFGEFGARTPGQCGSEATRWNGQGPFMPQPGMVRDTLLYSKAEKKKFPRKGTIECNSANLEKWFLPSSASSSVCKELQFRAKDTLGGTYYMRSDYRFFPLDSIPGAQMEGGPGYTFRPPITALTGVDVVPHNYNWCMEINAQFTYKKGQRFLFDGEDDIWAYIDNRLVVDKGGIHGSNNWTRYLLDSIPFLAGREGEVFDLDIYQCERRPGGSEMHMILDLELEPPKFLDLELTYPDGKYPHPSDALAGPTRFCAQPVYASQAPCSNSLPVPADPFTRATWTVGDRVLARDSACITFDPRDVPANTRMELAAKAEGKTARLPLQVVRANFPTAIVLAGNGRVDSIVLKLDARSDSLFAPVQVAFALGGAEQSHISTPERFRPERRSIVWALPGSGRGISGLTADDSLTGRVVQTVLGNLIHNGAPLVDSATPGILKASWTPRSDGGFDLEVTPTEPLVNPLPKPLDAFLFKDSRGLLLDPSNAGVVQGLQEDGSYRVAFPTGAVDPRRIDSVSFSGAVRDRAGNYARRLFTAIDPLAWGVGSARIASASIENSFSGGGSFEAVKPGRSLVLLAADGRALTPGAENDHLAATSGPVLSIRSAEPVETVDLRMYSNLGAFLHSERYVISPEEWDRLKAGSPGDTVTARILWYPVSDGHKLGTGAYIMKGSISTRRTWTRGSGGMWQEKAATLRLLGPLRFGFIRR
jgi:fibro-slime domain-containing protein